MIQSLHFALLLLGKWVSGHPLLCSSLRVKTDQKASATDVVCPSSIALCALIGPSFLRRKEIHWSTRNPSCRVWAKQIVHQAKVRIGSPEKGTEPLWVTQHPEPFPMSISCLWTDVRCWRKNVSSNQGLPVTAPVFFLKPEKAA